MPIRVARHSDIPRLAEVRAASFGPDAFVQFLVPHMHEHYQDFVGLLRRRIRESWWNYAKITYVSYEIVDDEGEATERNPLVKNGHGREVITGMAEWERIGEGWEKLWNINRWDPSKYMSPRRLLLASEEIARLGCFGSRPNSSPEHKNVYILTPAAQDDSSSPSSIATISCTASLSPSAPLPAPRPPILNQ